MIPFYFSYIAIRGLWLPSGAGQTWTEKGKGPWGGSVPQRVRWAARNLRGFLGRPTGAPGAGSAPLCLRPQQQSVWTRLQGRRKRTARCIRVSTEDMLRAGGEATWPSRDSCLTHLHALTPPRTLTPLHSFLHLPATLRAQSCPFCFAVLSGWATGNLGPCCPPLLPKPALSSAFLSP